MPTLIPPAGAPAGFPFKILKADLKSQDGRGTVWFDRTGGRVARAELDLRITGTLHLEIGMRHDGGHHPRRQAAAAVRGQHKDIAEPREGRVIGDNTAEADLLPAMPRLAFEQSEVQRTFEGAVEELARDPVRPVRLVVQVPPDDITVEVRDIRRDRESIVSPHASQFTVAARPPR